MVFLVHTCSCMCLWACLVASYKFLLLRWGYLLFCINKRDASSFFLSHCLKLQSNKHYLCSIMYVFLFSIFRLHYRLTFLFCVCVFQETIRKGCETLRKCEEMVSKLGLFSTNETKEDISTNNLKYLLVIDVLFSIKL